MRQRRASELEALLVKESAATSAIGPAGVINAPQAEYGRRAKGRPRKVAANGGKGGEKREGRSGEGGV